MLNSMMHAVGPTGNDGENLGNFGWIEGDDREEISDDLLWSQRSLAATLMLDYVSTRSSPLSRWLQYKAGSC